MTGIPLRFIILCIYVQFYNFTLWSFRLMKKIISVIIFGFVVQYDSVVCRLFFLLSDVKQRRAWFRLMVKHKK